MAVEKQKKTVIDNAVKPPQQDGKITSQQPMPVLAPVPQWEQDAYEYLLRNNWQLMGKNERGVSLWLDPYTVNQKTDKLWIELPVKAGDAPDSAPSRWSQTVTPCVPWNYQMEEAMYTQKSRDMAAADKARKAVA